MYKTYLVILSKDVSDDVDLSCELNYLAADCIYDANGNVSHYFFEQDKKHRLNILLKNYEIFI